MIAHGVWDGYGHSRRCVHRTLYSAPIRGCVKQEGSASYTLRVTAQPTSDDIRRAKILRWYFSYQKDVDTDQLSLGPEKLIDSLMVVDVARH